VVGSVALKECCQSIVRGGGDYGWVGGSKSDSEKPLPDTNPKPPNPTPTPTPNPTLPFHAAAALTPAPRCLGVLHAADHTAGLGQ